MLTGSFLIRFTFCTTSVHTFVDFRINILYTVYNIYNILIVTPMHIINKYHTIRAAIEV